MGNLTFEQSNQWRIRIKEKVLNHAKDTDGNVAVKNPNDYFNFLYKSHESEREVRNFDLWLIRNSNLIVVNFNDPKSIGTAQELAIAYELRIPILGLNAENYVLHPWLKECCDRIFVNESQLVDYITDFYLI